MSGSDAFFSFCNYLKTALNGTGITVTLEKDEYTIPPYLVMQPGPDRIRDRWVSDLLCQGWLVVEKSASEPLAVTMATRMKQVLAVSQDTGFIEKYDYSTTPNTLTGSVVPRITEITKDMSSDPRLSKKVITWQLASNASIRS